MVAYGFLTTFPPTRCAVATHSLALAQHLHDPQRGDSCAIVHAVDRYRPRPPQDPTVFLVKGRPWSAITAIEALNRFDVAIVQHDFGIYGGPDGEEVLGVVEALDTPVIAVLHAVPPVASEHRRLVLQRVIDAAAAVVVLSRADAATLREHYTVDPDRVSVIPRGAAAVTPRHPNHRPAGSAAPTILTWGLIGPGKGIEHAVAALARLRDLDPVPRYLICGQQDPRVEARQADAYRDLLSKTAREHGVADLVTFDPAFRPPGALSSLVLKADVVVLPYEERDRTTSAVLTEALAARRPVIATDFPHARELLGDGAGLIVPQHDPEALARALRRVLTEPELAKGMQARSGQMAALLAWPGVAAAFRDVTRSVLAQAPAVVSG
ncbi:glycosyltransferase [Actinospica durhamensis]|uniref:Glycosyltransferase n=1 Tax=Actinospica durhamensis TaxID=1508375 RepID=A0A941IQ28_9ACTN|nr:glycosyltransferase [Actinospica durhamensis]MBR7837195.1 glycosyltransferase [Actinospica durhamensis]